MAPLRLLLEGIAGDRCDAVRVRAVLAAGTTTRCAEADDMTSNPTGVSLEGIVLTDAVSGQLVDLGRQAGLTLVTVIRHRF